MSEAKSEAKSPKSLADELDLLVQLDQHYDDYETPIELQAHAVCKAWRREKLLTAEDILARAREKSRRHWLKHEQRGGGYNAAAGDALDELIYWAEEQMTSAPRDTAHHLPG